ncbi:hypothetical protein GCM10027300_24870 [Modestobacter lapidis]
MATESAETSRHGPDRAGRLERVIILLSTVDQRAGWHNLQIPALGVRLSADGVIIDGDRAACARLIGART